MNTFFPFGVGYIPHTDNLFPLPQLASLTISPDTVVAGEGATAGDEATATVSLNGPHPGIALKADLSLGNEYYAKLPSPPVAVINQNQTSANFTITTPILNVPFEPKEVLVYATSGGVAVVAKLTVKSRTEAEILESVTLAPAVVTGGQTSHGTVTLKGPVAQDTVVGLAAVETGGPFPRPGGESSVVSVKSSATVRAGDTIATFTVKTTDLPPHVTRTAKILAHAVVTKSAELTVEGS